jgi:hypothetical protein
MSINSRFAIDQKKVRKYGQFYGSIDFESDEKVSALVFADNPNKPVIGKFIIGNHEYGVTMDELEYIEQTCRNARETVLKRYRFGMMGKV